MASASNTPLSVFLRTSCLVLPSMLTSYGERSRMYLSTIAMNCWWQSAGVVGASSRVVLKPSTASRNISDCTTSHKCKQISSFVVYKSKHCDGGKLDNDFMLRGAVKLPRYITRVCARNWTLAQLCSAACTCWRCKKNE